MSQNRILIFACVCLPAVFAQAPTRPVVNPRGVINAFTQQPAPTVAASGGLIWITGLNLGPPEGAAATGSPLPTELGGIRVLINNQAIPLVSVSPGKIVAQVPWNVNPGAQQTLSQLVVESNGVRGSAARFFVRGAEPGLQTVGDTGYGEAAGKMSGTTVELQATGLGAVENEPEDGAAGPADLSATPKATMHAYVGGIPANITAALSPETAGVFDVNVEIPAGAKLGDMLFVAAGNRAANRVTWGKTYAPDVQFLPLPEGADLHAIVGSDLKAAYVIGNGARGDDGCYSAYVFDFAKKSVAPVDGCLTSGNKNALTPIVAVQDGAALMAFAGPPEGELPNPVSSQVRIFNPALDQALAVSLSESATTLTSLEGSAIALVAGTPPKAVAINVTTGEMTEANVGGALPGGGGGGGVAGGGGGGLLDIDLGEGLDVVLSPRTAVIQNRSVVIVGDDADKPTRAKLAVLDAQARVIATRDFPDGFLPLVGPKAAVQPGAGGGGLPGAGGGLPGAAQAVRFRVSFDYDTSSRVYYVLSHKPDNSAQALVAFNFAASGEKALVFPEKWYAASCLPNFPIYNLEVSRRLTLLVTNTPETEFKQQCYALGYLTVDLASQKMEAIPLAGEGRLNVASVSDMNDYLIGSNVGTQTQPADTLYVLDGVTASASRLQLPPGITSYAALRPIPAMGLMLALGQNRVAGDQGMVVFDLDNAETRILPVPEGFAAIQLVDIMTASRKVVARGTKTGNSGSQYLIYDLMTKDLMLAPNPAGVAWVGAVPNAATTPGGGGGGGGQQQTQAVFQDSSPKSNSVAAIGFDADRNALGVVLVRVP